jgi:hypothetical protein
LRFANEGDHSRFVDQSDLVMLPGDHHAVETADSARSVCRYR